MELDNVILIFIITLVCLYIISEIIHFAYLRKRKEKVELYNDHYYGGIFYYNPEDQRVLVPKRIAWAGWTLNFARPQSFVFIAFIIGLLIIAVVK